jgi:hypothetical protein
MSRSSPVPVSSLVKKMAPRRILPVLVYRAGRHARLQLSHPPGCQTMAATRAGV